MNYNEHLQLVLDYIEDNLKVEIEIDELATLLGFSTSHFQRIFNDYTKMTVSQYMTKRKLQYAIHQISMGKKSIDIAFEYGFNTYAGFYKAFKKEYGCSPKVYLQHIEVKPPQKFDLMEKSFKIFSYLELKKVLSHWNLPKQIKISNVDGKRRDRWLVNDEYVLKYLTHLNDIEKVIEVSELLGQHHIQVPQLISLSDGKKAIHLFDVYFYLEPYIKTSSVMDALIHESNEVSYDLGNKIGNIHRIFQRCQQDTLYQKVDFVKLVCDWAVPQIRNNMKTWSSTLPDSFWDDFMGDFRCLQPHLTSQLIHRKLSINNLLAKDNKVVGIRNMELVEQNFRIVDLCYLGTSILAVCFENETLRDRWVEVFKMIVVGYDQQVNLTKAEKKALIHLLFAIQFVFIAYLKNRDEEKQLLLTNVQMVSFIYEHRDRLAFNF
ncbi:MAG: helix-turn-helix domain-containing protein [Turicibacter sp.]